MSFSVQPGASALKFKRRWRRQEVLTKVGIRKGYLALRKDLVDEAVRSIRQPPKTGRLYRIPGRTLKHRASAPGQAPANMTGELARSISAVQRGWDELHFGADTRYAKALELGNPAGNLQPRPYLIRSIEANERNALKHFEREIEAALTMG